MANDFSNFNLKERLLDKSIEAYVLSLETINRLTIEYRLESFCYLFCNAWELLLKAKIIHDSGQEASIHYKKKNKDDKAKSFSLRDCLKKVMLNEKDPVRRNIERVEDLRDESVHLVISRIPRDVIGLFQSGAINYHNRLNKWFGESLADRYPLSMMTIVYDLSPEQSDMADAQLRMQLGIDAAEYLSRYCADLRRESIELERSAEFAIGIEYRLVLTKRRDDGDIILSAGTGDGEPAQVVEVAKDPSTTHPYRQKELIEEVNQELGNKTVNQYDITCLNVVHKVKANREYFFQGKVKGSPGQYSRAFVDWVIGRYRQDKGFFQQVRAKSKEIMQSR